MLLYVTGGIVGIFMFVTFAKSGHFMRNFLASAATGLMGLLASWGVGLLGLNLINMNILSVLAAAVLGLPGVIGLMLARLMVM